MTQVPTVRIRGIYATALTTLLQGAGFPIADPSATIRGRIRLPQVDGLGEVSITDRRDHQGVILYGLAERVDQVRTALQQALPHTLFAPETRGVETSAFQEDESQSWARREETAHAALAAEFPATVKGALDAVRSTIVSTIPGHHWLKVIDPDPVDQAELDLEDDPSLARSLARDLAYLLVYAYLVPGTAMEIDHVKAGERRVRVRGTISNPEKRGREHKRGALLLERQFKGGGSYDSLGEPIMPGDFGTIALAEGDWVVRRHYYRANGELIGELDNINTPVELYPDHARYVDLEVDVMFLPPDTVRIVDQAVLDRKVGLGLVPPSLAEEAMRQARAVAEGLRQGAGRG